MTILVVHGRLETAVAVNGLNYMSIFNTRRGQWKPLLEPDHD